MLVVRTVEDNAVNTGYIHCLSYQQELKWDGNENKVTGMGGNRHHSAFTGVTT